MIKLVTGHLKTLGYQYIITLMFVCISDIIHDILICEGHEFVLSGQRVYVLLSQTVEMLNVMFVEFVVSAVGRAAYAHRSPPLIRGAQETGRLKFSGVCSGNLHTFTKPRESGRLLSKQIQTNTASLCHLSACYYSLIG